MVTNLNFFRCGCQGILFLQAVLIFRFEINPWKHCKSIQSGRAGKLILRYSQVDRETLLKFDGADFASMQSSKRKYSQLKTTLHICYNCGKNDEIDYGL